MTYHWVYNNGNMTGATWGALPEHFWVGFVLLNL